MKKKTFCFIYQVCKVIRSNEKSVKVLVLKSYIVDAVYLKY